MKESRIRNDGAINLYLVTLKGNNNLFERLVYNNMQAIQYSSK